MAFEAVVGVVAVELLLHWWRGERMQLPSAPIRGHQHVHHCINILQMPQQHRKTF
jgi:hypothetical protein